MSIKKSNQYKLSLMDSIRKGGVKILTISWLLLILVLASVVGILYLEDNNNDWAIHTLTVRNQLIEVLSTIKDAETGQRGFLLDGEEKYLESYYSAAQKVDSLLAQIMLATAENPVQKSKMIPLKNLVKRKFNEMGETVKLAKNNQYEKAIGIFRSDIGFRMMSEIKVLLKDMSQEETKVLERIREKTAWLRWFAIGLISTSIIIIGVGLYNISSKTIPLMKELSETRTSLDQSIEELQQTNQYLRKCCR